MDQMGCPGAAESLSGLPHIQYSTLPPVMPSWWDMSTSKRWIDKSQKTLENEEEAVPCLLRYIDYTYAYYIYNINYITIIIMMMMMMMMVMTTTTPCLMLILCYPPLDTTQFPSSRTSSWSFTPLTSRHLRASTGIVAVQLFSHDETLVTMLMRLVSPGKTWCFSSRKPCHNIFTSVA